jgi:4-hydroxy-4-methyl-2-oxoglutarate aldolase
MIDHEAFGELSPTTLADVVGGDGVMGIGIRPLWPGMPRVVGPAFPVRCCSRGQPNAPCCHLPSRAGVGHCCRGRRRGLRGGGRQRVRSCSAAWDRRLCRRWRDSYLAEIRAIGFPVFARGVIPIPGAKNVVGVFGVPVNCGGVEVALGDIVVADEEGIVAVPGPRSEEILQKARALAAGDAASTLESWEAAHHARIDQALRDQGFAG